MFVRDSKDVINNTAAVTRAWTEMKVGWQNLEQQKGGGTVGLAGGLNTCSREKATGMRPPCLRDEAHLSLYLAK